MGFFSKTNTTKLSAYEMREFAQQAERNLIAAGFRYPDGVQIAAEAARLVRHAQGFKGNSKVTKLSSSGR